jgi:hypothetical protein
MNAAPDDIFQIPDSVVTREIVGETLLVPISGDLADMDNIFALNNTGAFIWGKLDGETRLASIRDQICEAFEVESPDAWEDMQVLLAELNNAGLINKVENR